MGASAGAMVLCGQMWLPDGGDRIVAGLGAVTEVLVLPHYTGGPPPIEAPDGVDLLGVPECSGVLVTPDGMMGVGANPSVRPFGSVRTERSAPYDVGRSPAGTTGHAAQPCPHAATLAGGQGAASGRLRR